jgi:hypothetical protein
VTLALQALTKLYDKYACIEFKNNWKELEALAGYRSGQFAMDCLFTPSFF